MDRLIISIVIFEKRPIYGWALTSSQAFQVAQGSVQTDADGSRQATVFFPQNTSATMTLPNGSTQALSTLNVRATEYTVGENGPESMPGELPISSGYTYAVELSVDEAITAGATRVDFSQSLPVYVDNFLNFPTGEIVPAGWYDRNKAAWIPSKNGRIIEVQSIDSGLAELFVDGNGVQADAASLAELGISDTERQYLARTYTVGTSLWRVEIDHFTPWDFNWPIGPPQDAIEPPVSDVNLTLDPEDSDICAGCIIEPQSQTLGEVIPVVGTPFSLNYRSDRTQGYKTNRTLDISLTEDTIPQSLKRIELKIGVAGQIHRTSFSSLTINQKYSFEWDGLDAYGRPISTATARVTLGYVYDGAYYEAEREFDASFARFSNSTQFIGNRSNLEVTLNKSWKTHLGFAAVSAGLGGWTLSVNHTYDPLGQVFYGGDGDKRSAQSISDIITTYAGNGMRNYSGDGGLATSASLKNLGNIALGKDGSLYIVDSSDARIRKVTPDGFITTVAGIGSWGFSGDGGPATEAKLRFPEGIAIGPDNSLYFSDTGNYRIRKISQEGIISTIAGNGIEKLYGDGIPALQASFRSPQGITVAPDGSLYIADSSRIRKITPDGIINTVVENGDNWSYDGDKALEGGLGGASFITLGKDGSLYISDTGNQRIIKVSPDGIMTTIAGLGYPWFSGDGGPAKEAGLYRPQGLAFDEDGNLYIADSYNHYIRKISTDGIITSVAGDRIGRFAGDSGLPTLASLSRPKGLALSPDGSLYIGDTANNRIRRIRSPLPDLGSTDILISNRSGNQLFEFSPQGRHLRTIDTITGETLLTFAYTSEGLLSTITDIDGDTTIIERYADGIAYAIVAHDGQRTTLNLDTNGYLNSIRNPAGDTHNMRYSDQGLMLEYTNPRHYTNILEYDELGLLKSDSDPLGGGWFLERTENESGYTVSMTSGEERVRSFSVEPLSTGDRRQVNTAPDGTTTTTIHGKDSSETVTTANGTQLYSREGPDPRFGMLSPVPEEVRVTTPAGLVNAITNTRTATLADAADLFSHTSLTDTANINGRFYSRVFNTATSTYTHTSAENRIQTRSMNSKGRISQLAVPGIEPVNYFYDDRGRIKTVQTGFGSESRDFILDYNYQGYLASLTDAENQQVSFEYDLAGRITEQTLADGRVIGFGYDANGNLTRLTPPGRPAHQFDYTAVDNRSDYTPPSVSGVANTATTYDYNLDKQLELVTRPDGKIIDLNYDPTSGKLVSTVIPRGNYGYGYTASTGQLNQITAPDGAALGYSYDGSLLTSVNWSGSVTGRVSQSFNNDFIITQRSVNGGNSVNFGYDNDLLLTSAGNLTLSRDSQNGLIMGTSLNSLNTSRSYNSFAEMSGYNANYGSSDLYATSYSRDKIGRITQQVETIEGMTTTLDYHYDLAGRLDEVKTNAVITASYRYDANSNRTHVNGVPVGQYDNQDRLIQYQSDIYSYTDNGELLSKTDTSTSVATQYSYDVLGNLMQVVLADTTTVDYLIDGQNRRVGKKVDGVQQQGWLYKDQLNPIAELDGSGNLVSRFVYADKAHVPAYMEKAGVSYRIISDHLGSPRLVVNTRDGSIAQRIDYDVWGNVTKDTNPGFQPFGFAGGLYDQDTGLVRFGARDYDAVAGRWVSKDPVGFAGGDTNLFGYVVGDPVNFVDPAGLTPESCYRSLRGSPIGANANSLDKRLNTVIGHEHIFFDDGSDIGYGGGNGIYSGEDKKEYSQCEDTGGSKDKIMKIIDKIKGDYEVGDYSVMPKILGGNNCQDFVDEIKDNL